MDPEVSLLGEPSDTRDRIMHATFHALGKYGYAGLSIQRIADEADLSKGSFYNHYDGKDDLLLAFLDFMLDRYRALFQVSATDDPAADLRRYMTNAISGRGPPGIDPDEFAEDVPMFGPFIELRAQAVSSPAFRERFTELDGLFADQLASVIQRGIDQGQFLPVDPDVAAEAIITFLMGAIFRRGTAERFETARIEAAVDDILEQRLLAE